MRKYLILYQNGRSLLVFLFCYDGFEIEENIRFFFEDKIDFEDYPRTEFKNFFEDEKEFEFIDYEETEILNP